MGEKKYFNVRTKNLHTIKVRKTFLKSLKNQYRLQVFSYCFENDLRDFPVALWARYKKGKKSPPGMRDAEAF